MLTFSFQVHFLAVVAASCGSKDSYFHKFQIFKNQSYVRGKFSLIFAVVFILKEATVLLILHQFFFFFDKYYVFPPLLIPYGH